MFSQDLQSFFSNINVNQILVIRPCRGGYSRRIGLSDINYTPSILVTQTQSLEKRWSTLSRITRFIDRHRAIPPGARLERRPVSGAKMKLLPYAHRSQCWICGHRTGILNFHRSCFFCNEVSGSKTALDDSPFSFFCFMYIYTCGCVRVSALSATMANQTAQLAMYVIDRSPVGSAGRQATTA